jgi:hypothetical protein
MGKRGEPWNKTNTYGVSKSRRDLNGQGQRRRCYQGDQETITRGSRLPFHMITPLLI